MLGSAWFYLEFLLEWWALLGDAGYRNPAVFALEYTLAPDARYPAQIHEAAAAYQHVLHVAGNDPRRVCIGADSAGATLALSLMLVLAQLRRCRRASSGRQVSGAKISPPNPELAVLISPWTSLVTDHDHNPLHKHNDEHDYLDMLTLWRYAHQYASSEHLHQAPANPGACCDDELWRQAAPRRGFHVSWGSDEILAGDASDFVARQRSRNIAVEDMQMAGRPHAWPVASVFLAASEDERFEGLREIVRAVSRHIPTR